MSERWFVAIRGKKFGPLSESKLRSIAEKGMLTVEDHVWRKGMKDWVQAKEIRGLIPDEIEKEVSRNGSSTEPREWYYNNAGNRLGPVTVSELKHLAEKGVITKETFLLQQGAKTGWRLAEQCHDLALALVSKGMSHSHPVFKLLTKWKS